MAPVVSPPDADRRPTAPASGPEFELGVIKEARRRRRRRRVAIATVALATVALAGALHFASGGGGGSPRPSAPLSNGGVGPRPFEAPAAVLARAPYLGVACPVPNSIACDRVGLAVWLRRPAIAVRATIAGAPLALDWAGDRPPRFAARGARTAFDGFLEPAGLIARLGVDAGEGRIWRGENAPSPLVRLRIEYRSGRSVVTQERVLLAAGWG